MQLFTSTTVRRPHALVAQFIIALALFVNVVFATPVDAATMLETGLDIRHPVTINEIAIVDRDLIKRANWWKMTSNTAAIWVAAMGGTAAFGAVSCAALSPGCIWFIGAEALEFIFGTIWSQASQKRHSLTGVPFNITEASHPRLFASVGPVHGSGWHYHGISHRGLHSASKHNGTTLGVLTWHAEDKQRRDWGDESVSDAAGHVVTLWADMANAYRAEYYDTNSGDWENIGHQLQSTSASNGANSNYCIVPEDTQGNAVFAGTFGFNVGWQDQYTNQQHCVTQATSANPTFQPTYMDKTPQPE